jgi:hypothetical protein
MKQANRFGPPVELMVSNPSAQPTNSPRACQQTRGGRHFAGDILLAIMTKIC